MQHWWCWLTMQATSTRVNFLVFFQNMMMTLNPMTGKLRFNNTVRITTHIIFQSYEETKTTYYGMSVTFARIVNPNHKLLLAHNPSSHIKLLQLFKSKEALKVSLEMKCVHEGFQNKVNKFSTYKVEVVCFVKDYKWRRESIKYKITKKFQIHKLLETHICSNIQLQSHHRQVNMKVLGRSFKNILAENTSNMLWGNKSNEL